ncbi:hypothetical protein SELMODRAFT_409900 [Selaginella moellendorffii]|uniref:Uncharacterized protein n=1 Tax=Selaginella moellendorffii TaxID=88036 RepID=D8RCU2_SELML|nr:hypothetical protein SELMODRAFT_409900 [Selaginella moellendorffii]
MAWGQRQDRGIWDQRDRVTIANTPGHFVGLNEILHSNAVPAIHARTICAAASLDGAGAIRLVELDARANATGAKKEGVAEMEEQMVERTFIFFEADIGVNYGRVANNLLQPDQVVNLIKSLQFKRVKIFDTDQTVLQAFANS